MTPNTAAKAEPPEFGKFWADVIVEAHTERYRAMFQLRDARRALEQIASSAECDWARHIARTALTSGATQ